MGEQLLGCMNIRAIRKLTFRQQIVACLISVAEFLFHDFGMLDGIPGPGNGHETPFIDGFTSAQADAVCTVGNALQGFIDIQQGAEAMWFTAFLGE